MMIFETFYFKENEKFWIIEKKKCFLIWEIINHYYDFIKINVLLNYFIVLLIFIYGYYFPLINLSSFI